MLTPYDWQEGIGHRAQYIEAKLAQGAPVVAVSLADGVLLYTKRRQSRKIFEVYDRLIFAAIGQQSDVEALRTGAVDFAHQEGFNRSEEDVTIQRVVTALSAGVKKAFSDFSSSPIVARSLFSEVGPIPDEDLHYVLDYDGDYRVSRHFAVVAGQEAVSDSIAAKLEGFKAKTTPEKAVQELGALWDSAVVETEIPNKDLKPEAVLLSRSSERENRFRVIVRDEV